MKLFFTTSIILISLLAFGQEMIEVDLKARWTPIKDSVLNSDAKVVSIQLKPSDLGRLLIRSRGNFSVFIDRQLVVNQTDRVDWKLDSLKEIHIFPITLSIYSQSGIEALQTYLEKENHSLKKPESGLKNVVTIISILLAWLFIFLIAANRASFFEYLNLKNLIAIRINEEASFAQRITSSSNIFVYSFCALLSALVIIVLNETSEISTFDILLRLFQIFLGILVFLLLKILMTSLFSKLFGLGEYGPGQFFFFVSFALITFGTVALILLFQFIIGINVSSWNGAVGVFIFGMGLMYITITFMRHFTKGGLTVFHLFSYLCSSEIFPAILLLKIFYY